MKHKNHFNYIFVVDNFDENAEKIEDGAYHLSQYLYNEFHVKMEYSVLALFSIETRRVTIRTGEITKNDLTDTEAGKIISDLGNLLRAKRYYDAFLKYYSRLDVYMDSKELEGWMIFMIVFVVLFVLVWATMGILALKDKCREWHSLPNNSKLKNIVSFLKSQKTNNKIFSENCIICLNKLIRKKDKKEINIELKEKKEVDNKELKETPEDGNIPLIEKEAGSKEVLVEKDNSNDLIDKQEEGISTLKCGHQFHTECIIKWLKIKDNCPICRQIVLNEKDNNKIVWNTQIELNPTFNKINYSHLYTRDFYVPSISSSSYNYSSNYSYTGGCNCGGGATGGW